jgi:hypothetical protein
MIKIIEEDLVDFEPLVMRFHGRERLSPTEAKRVAQFIISWFNQNAASDPGVWRFAKEWKAEVSQDGVVRATCDLMPPETIPLLAAAVEHAFPSLREVRLGHVIKGANSGYDWMPVEAASVAIDGKIHDVAPFIISFSPVTVLMFEEFIGTTNYTPVPDLSEYKGFMVENARGAFGASPKVPMFGVTYDDACAYCEWAHLRLPSGPELLHFFESSVRADREFQWAFPCWSSTLAERDVFVAGCGPYVTEALNSPIDQHRRLLHRKHYGWPEPACFRVVKA